MEEGRGLCDRKQTYVMGAEWSNQPEVVNTIKPEVEEVDTEER